MEACHQLAGDLQMGVVRSRQLALRSSWLFIVILGQKRQQIPSLSSSPNAAIIIASTTIMIVTIAVLKRAALYDISASNIPRHWSENSPKHSSSILLSFRQGTSHSLEPHLLVMNETKLTFTMKPVDERATTFTEPHYWNGNSFINTRYLIHLTCEAFERRI